VVTAHWAWLLERQVRAISGSSTEDALASSGLISITLLKSAIKGVNSVKVIGGI
jgi:hypothetical protein